MLDYRTAPAAPARPFAPVAAHGPMAERIRTHDWSATALGARRDWPASLRAAIGMMLASREPMCLWWGPQQVNLHNDACAALLGCGALTDPLGAPAATAWAAWWSALGPRARAAQHGENRGSGEPVALVIERDGRAQEAHFELGFARLEGRGGGGLVCTFHDVTARVVWDRQLALLRALAGCGGAATLEGAYEHAAQVLGGAPTDIPFAALYTVNRETRRARLGGHAGLAPGHRALPLEFGLDDAQAPWPFAEALLETRRAWIAVVLDEARFGPLPAGRRRHPPEEGAVVALTRDPHARETPVLVLALNPFRAACDDASRFVELVASPVAAAISAAHARHEERRRLEAETLQQVALDLASELDLSQLVQKVTDAGTSLTGASVGAFFYNATDENGQGYRLQALSGVPRDAIARLAMPRATPLFMPTCLGEGPVRVDDVARDPRYGKVGPHHGMPAGHPPVRSYLAVPVVSRTGEVLGGLFFGHSRPGVFDAEAERSALGIAAQAAVAIDNARLFGQARNELGQRSRVEDELRAAERESSGLLAALPAAVYTTDAEGRIRHYNEAAVKLWGRRPDPARDQWCGSHRVFAPDGRPMPLETCPMADVLHGRGTEARAEVIIERPDGSRRHVLAHPRALRDSRGRVVGAVNMLVDITERKAAEAELAATKDQLALQVESVTRLHELAMALGGMTDLRPALEAVLATAVEGQGASFGLVWLQDPRTGELVVEARHGFGAATRDLFQRVAPGPGGGGAGNAFARGTRWVIEDVETDASFEPFRAAARAAGIRALHSTPIVTRSGALLGVLSVHYEKRRRPHQHEMQLADVCARHAADAIEAFRNQEMLRESERLYRAIGESIDYGIWICDPEGRNVYQSESMLRLVGRTADQNRGLGWLDVIHPDDREGCAGAWREAVRTGAQFDREHRVLGTDGRWHPILSRGVPVRNERGEITAWAGIALDIARLKRVENELRELDQRKNEFLATLAHELRNPLAPLRNGLELMRIAGAGPQTAQKAREMMERQLAQMVRLVDDLLDVSRVSRGKIELRRADIELATVLRNALETSQPLMAERGHELVARIPGEPVVVHGDLTRLSQVFWNLLNNAAKYTERGGRIELAVVPGEGEVAVAVRDNGIGIPPDMQARVFDIFTQVDRSLEKAQGGLGIGLSIAKRLVEMHGGSIAVKSGGHGHGSEFTVRLPARIGRARPSPEEAVARDEAPPPQRRVLIADDNADSAETLALILQAMGNEVRVAHDGAEAVALAAQFRPDTILLDIGMPKLNGYDACARIRAEPWAAGTHIVALTGWGQQEDKERSHAAGFDRHLVKPVEPAMLEKLLCELPPRAA